MRTLRPIRAYHLIDMVSVIAVRVAVVIADNSELKLALRELRREFPVANSEVLLWY